MSEQSWSDQPIADVDWGDAPTAPALPPAAVATLPVERVSGDLADATGHAVWLYRHPDEVSRLAGDLGRRLTDLVQTAHAEALAERTPGRVTEEVVAPELRVLADAATTLDALGKVLTAAAKLARDTAGEVLLEVRPDDEQRTSTVKASDGHGRLLKVTRSQPTAVSVRQEEVLDVLVAYLLSREVGGGNGWDPAKGQDLAYAAGAREGTDELLALVGPLAWKSTALDDLGRKLDDAGEHALAIRLGHAHARVAKGSPAVKVERLEVKP